MTRTLRTAALTLVLLLGAAAGEASAGLCNSSIDGKPWRDVWIEKTDSSGQCFAYYCDSNGVVTDTASCEGSVEDLWMY